MIFAFWIFLSLFVLKLGWNLYIAVDGGWRFSKGVESKSSISMCTFVEVGLLILVLFVAIPLKNRPWFAEPLYLIVGGVIVIVLSYLLMYPLARISHRIFRWAGRFKQDSSGSDRR